jgi:hypothetical protein
LTLDIVGLAEQMESGREELLLLAARRFGYLPEDFVDHAMTKDPHLLPAFVASKLPVENAGFHWKNGREPVDEWADVHNDTESRELVKRYFPVLARRKTRLASHVDDLSRYKSDTEEWELRAMGLPRSQSDDFAKFATAICVFYLPVDCGPPELLERARQWFERLPACARDNLERLGEPACRLYGRAKEFPENTVTWYSWEGGKPATRRQLKTWSGLVKDYPLREWPAKN